MSLIDVVKNQWNRLLPSKQARIFRRWKNDGAEELRYEYDLNTDSVVFDVGGYEGHWAAEIFKIYGSTIHIFEPVKEYADKIKKAFFGNARIIVHQSGLSDKNTSREIVLDDNKSSLFINGSRREKVNLTKASDFILENAIENIDLMKINIEGGEYELMENLVQTGLIKKIKNIQIQFHDFVPHAEARMKKIQTALAETHHLTYQYKFVWENWERNQ